MPLKSWTRWLNRRHHARKATSPAQRRTPKVPLGVQHLEDRLTPAVSFTDLANGLSTQLTTLYNAQASIGTVNDLPVLNEPFSAVSEARSVFKGIRNRLVPAINGLAPASEGAAVQTAVYQALTSGFVPILGDTNNDSAIDINDVLVSPYTAADNEITITATLKKNLDDGLSGTTDFGLGLPGLPFLATSQNDVSVRVGFEYQNFTFGISNGQFEFNADVANELTFTVDATIPETDITKITGVFGFLTFNEITDQGITDPNLTTRFQGAVTLDVTGTGLNNPRLTGQADIHLHLDTAYPAAEITFPDLTADLNLTWTFYSSDLDAAPAQFGYQPFLSFDNVQLDIGAFLSGTLGPQLEKLKAILDPIKSDLETLLEPVPGVGFFTGSNSSVVDLAAQLGIVPPETPDFVRLAHDLSVVVGDIPTITTALQQPKITLGSLDLFDLNLRNLEALELSDYFAVGQNLTEIVATNLNLLDFQDIKDAILNQIADPTTHESAERLLDFLDPDLDTKAKKIDVQAPILQNPGEALNNLLFGEIADVLHVAATIQLENPTKQLGPYLFPIGPVPAFFELSTDIAIDAHVGFGYDNTGLREFMQDALTSSSPNADLLLNGLYLDMDTHVMVKGDVSGSFFSISPFHYASISGGIETNPDLTLSIPVANDLDGDGKFRPFAEPSSCLFHVDGQLSAELDITVAIGVIIPPPGIGFYYDEYSLHVPHTVLVDWSFGCIPNPFTSTDPNLASTNADFPSLIPAGTLRLNVGPSAMARTPGVGTGVINEVYTITTTSDGKVKVSAFGLSEEFEGITQIVADGGDGADIITAGEGVTAAIKWNGGIGNDQLKAAGSGLAMLYGDDGDDVLIAGDGAASLYGGNHKDHLWGGSVSNWLDGGNHDDILAGGDGRNTGRGGLGNDELYAGPLNDDLDGEAGDDQISGRIGNDILKGGSGNDSITWQISLGSPEVVTVDGGGGDDTFGLGATPLADIITADPETITGVLIKAPAATIHADLIESLNIEGFAGADTITVNYLPAGVRNVGINLGDEIAPDGAVDLVTVRFRPIADAVTVEKDTVLLYPGDEKDGQYAGGIMRIYDERLTVRTANILDDLRVHLGDGNDVVNVRSITGPTKVYGGAGGNDGDDIFVVSASASGGYLADLDLDAGRGVNTLHVNEAGSVTADTITVTSTRISSNLIPGVNYIATDGTYGGGVRVSAGVMSDTVNVRDTLTGVVTTVHTGPGDDQVNVSSNAPANAGDLAGIRGTLTVDLGTGAGNVLTLSDFAATGGNQDVKVLPTQVQGFAGPADATVVNFQATGGQLQLDLHGSNGSALAEQFTVRAPLAPLSLQANAGADVIFVEALSQPATINTGIGNDAITVADAGSTLNSLGAPLTVNGDADNDTLAVVDTGTAAGQTYSLGSSTINRAGAGLITHNGLESVTITSGAFNDQFTVTALQTVPVNVQTGQGSDLLRGPNSGGAWQITGGFSGVLNGNVQFAGVDEVRGGSGADQFVFTPGISFTGTVNGGTGASPDSLDYSAFSQGVTVVLPSQSATGVIGDVVGVEWVVGGSGNDLLIGDASDNRIWGAAGDDILVGKDGADRLFGESGRDLLFGGLGTDQLLGGIGDDILIGGVTSHDTNPHGGDKVALQALRAEWTRTDLGYKDRIKHLVLGGGLNGSYKLNSSTVADDGAVDSLAGQEDQDWFWATTVTWGPSVADLIDATPTEVVSS